MKALRYFILFLILAAAGCAGAPPPIDLSSYVWPPPPAEPKIKLVKFIVSDLDVRELSTAEALLGEEYSFAFGKPHAIAVDAEGNIYVTDTRKGEVTIINLNTARIGALFSSYGWMTPVGIAVDDENGLLAVADATARGVYVFGLKNRKLLYALTKTGEFVNPSGVAFSPKKKILYISDSKGHAIYAYNSLTGERIRTVAERGTGLGQVYFPAELATDKEGKLYVVDTLNFRFQVFDAEGKPLKTFGEHGDRPGMFARPKGIAVSDDGYVFVTDAAFGNFQVFDVEGNVYLYVGATGRGLGMFSIPQGIAIDRNDRIYVTDQVNRRVQIFQYMSERYKQTEALKPAEPQPVKK